MRQKLVVIGTISLLTVWSLSTGSVSAQFSPTMLKEWSGMVDMRTKPDGTFAMVLVDLVGGARNQTPGSAPDGKYDWNFYILGPCAGPKSFKGMATLYPQGDFLYLEALEIIPESGRPFTFVAKWPAGDRRVESDRGVRVQRIATAGRNVPDPGTNDEVAKARFADKSPMLMEAACPQK